MSRNLRLPVPCLLLLRAAPKFQNDPCVSSSCLVAECPEHKPILHIGPPQGRDNRSVTEFCHLKRNRVVGYRTIILSDPTSALSVAAPDKTTLRSLDTVRYRSACVI